MSAITIPRNKLLTTLDWFLFFIFCIVAFVFCWPMVKSYDSKKTSMSQHTEEISERPSITICFQARSGKGEPGNGVETNAFDDGGAFGKKTTIMYIGRIMYIVQFGRQGVGEAASKIWTRRRIRRT